jgi:hypothetical protein
VPAKAGATTEIIRLKAITDTSVLMGFLRCHLRREAELEW